MNFINKVNNYQTTINNMNEYYVYMLNSGEIKVSDCETIFKDINNVNSKFTTYCAVCKDSIQAVKEYLEYLSLPDFITEKIKIIYDLK